MLTRLKTLPLPTIGKAHRATRARVIATVEAPSDDGALIIHGDGPAAAQAREAIAALDVPARRRDEAQVILATADAVPVEPDPGSGVAPRTWLIARPGAGFTALPGVCGIVVDPVTLRMIHGLLIEAADPHGAQGSRPAQARAAVVAATILEDSERHLDEIADAFGADEARVWLREAAELRPVDRTDHGAPAAARLAADTGLPVVIDEGHRVSTWLAIWCARGRGEEPAGLLALRRDGVTGFAGIPTLELDQLAGRLAIELSWLRVHRRVVAEQERLRAAAMIEPLTGAWTRPAFERTVEIELAGARRRGEVLSMVLFDIDGLRRINEKHGHPAGDAVLGHVAAVIRANVRVNDEIGRFGDDEVAVLLMNSSLDSSRMVAEKLVRKIHEAGLEVGGEEIGFTVRAGVTELDVEGEKTGDDGFARAVLAVEQASHEPTRVATCIELADDSPDVHLIIDEDAQVGSMIGTTLAGGYRIVHEINHGASGVVYRGEDLGLGRPVAIKVLRHDLGRDAELVAHFRREASLLASLRHPNLVGVYAFGAADDVYFVMELVEGPTVADVVDDAVLRGEWLDADGIAEVVSEIADALEAMHAAGLVHCDVKPENVIIDRNVGRAVLVDVGECKRHDEARRRAGTPNYAAPESFSDGDETAAIDVYSLGATAYMMLTARLPFGVGDALAILSRQLDAPPPPPSTIRRGLSEAVDVVILKAMSVDPAQRFQTPGAFAAALRTALRGSEPMSAVPGPLPTERVGQLRELTIDEDTLNAERELEIAPLVRGAAFRVAAKVLAARVGEPWLRRIAEVRRDLADVLSPALPPMSWHSLEQLIELVSCSTGDVDDGEVLRTIGRGLVSSTFGHLYGGDPASMSTLGLLGSVPRLWSRYFSSGEAIVLGAGDDRIVLQVAGWSTSEAAAELVAGVLERIAELTGVTRVRVAVSTGALAPIFTVEWSDDVE